MVKAFKISKSSSFLHHTILNFIVITCFTTSTFGQSDSDTPKTSLGEELFYERCGYCHGVRHPRIFTKEEWISITDSMFELTAVDEEEKEIILNYLMKNAFDADY
jgi:trimethylamine-N-oxide reductase (cytochrome c)